MQTPNTLPTWMDRLQAQITKMEWQWRQLDEQEWHDRGNNSSGQTALAKRGTQAEVARLRAELAVAEFLDAFHAGTGSEIGQTVARQLRENAWHDATLNPLGVALFAHTSAVHMAVPDGELRWGAITSRCAAAADTWRVEVEGSDRWHGVELGRYRYCFHVVGDRVEAWTALAGATLVASAGPPTDPDTKVLPRVRHVVTDTVERWLRGRRVAHPRG